MGDRLKYRISLTISMLLAVMCTALSGIIIGEKSEAAASQIKSSESVLSVNTAKLPLYKVIADGGKIHVLDLTIPENSRILDHIDTRMMRKSDLDMLEMGIELYNDDELASFMEDFGS